MDKFGVEIECLLPPGAIEKIINELRDKNITAVDAGYTHRVSKNWKIVSDGSLSSMGANKYGAEFVSPILTFDKECFEQIRAFTDAIVKEGGIVNKTCGVHVHIDANNMTAKDVFAIIKAYSKHEKEFDSLMEQTRRNNDNTYACSIPSDIEYNSRSISKFISTRYCKINTQSYSRYGTIEFRHHHGTLDGDRIVKWIKSLKQFCQNVIDKNSELKAKTIYTYETRLPENTYTDHDRSSKFMRYIMSAPTGMMRFGPHSVRGLINSDIVNFSWSTKGYNDFRSYIFGGDVVMKPFIKKMIKILDEKKYWRYIGLSSVYDYDSPSEVIHELKTTHPDITDVLYSIKSCLDIRELFVSKGITMHFSQPNTLNYYQFVQLHKNDFTIPEHYAILIMVKTLSMMQNIKFRKAKKSMEISPVDYIDGIEIFKNEEVPIKEFSADDTQTPPAPEQETEQPSRDVGIMTLADLDRTAVITPVPATPHLILRRPLYIRSGGEV